MAKAVSKTAAIAEPIEEVKQVEEVVSKEIEPIAELLEKPNELAVVEEKVNIVTKVDETTIEDKIKDFLKGRDGEIKLNPFLKSLYPHPIMNEPPAYLKQGESKYLKHIIQGMVDKKEFTVIGDTHQLLGKFYYNDSEQKTKYNDVNNVEIIVKK